MRWPIESTFKSIYNDRVEKRAEGSNWVSHLAFPKLLRKGWYIVGISWHAVAKPFLLEGECVRSDRGL